MEWYVPVLVGALTAFAGYFVGLRTAPKNRSLSDTIKFYEETMDGLRSEIRRWKGRASYYMKGPIPNELGQTDNVDSLIEGIFEALPPNLRQLAAPFKGTAKEYAKQNPEIVETLKGQILQKLGGKSNEEQQQVADML